MGIIIWQIISRNMNKVDQVMGNDTINVTKVSYKDDSRQRFCGSVVIQDQDHTLGNCLRYQLIQDNRVVFAGYKKHHPLEEKIEIKVQTNGEIPPPDAILDSCGKLSQTLGKLVENFRQEV